VAFIYWKVRPELFHLGPVTVRWYGLFFALLFLAGYFIVRWRFRVEKQDLASLDALCIYMVAGTIIGARLGHCLLYDPGYFLCHPVEILEVWKGGLASHGGAAGVLVAVGLYSRRHPDQPCLWLLDRIVVPAALGGACIRVGNLFNSEILGTPTHLPWGVIFANVDSVPRHPAQLYESVAYLLVFLGFLWVYRRWRERTPRGLLLGLFLVSVFTFRFLIEFIKERQASYEQNLPLSVGQWLSLPFVAGGLLLLWRVQRDMRL
jgi:phosphatidylglycerol:prolipoprotein diacylglycerol transferase